MRLALAVIRQLRMRVGAAVMGGGFWNCLMRLWAIHDAAKRAVTPEGRVVLAECEPLADALYRDIGGKWELTLRRVAPPETDKGTPGDR